MDRPVDSQKPLSTEKEPPAAKKDSPLSYRNLYLIVYNGASMVLWQMVFFRVALWAGVYGTRNVHPGVGGFVKWTQTLAGLEVVHSVLGIVRAPLATTVLQVGSRFMLVWGIVNTFPSATGSSPAYTTMLLAWSITEIIRYSYFVANLVMGSSEVPEFLTWLRYNTFFVLYPVGILSECWLVWLAVAPARREYGEPAGWLLGGVLGVYVPGSYMLFTHMMAQRRKVMRGLAERDKKTR